MRFVAHFLLLWVISVGAFTLKPFSTATVKKHQLFNQYEKKHISASSRSAKSTNLQMVLSLESITPSLISLSVIAGVTAFHEGGHFLAAKVQGIKIQSFNVGYGPKVIAFNDTNDTEYALRALPLGGYVAFPMNVEYNEEGEVVKELDDPDLLQNRPPLSRAFVISAGVMANFLLSILLCGSVSLSSGFAEQVYGNGLVVNSQQVDSPAGKVGVQAGDVIRQINGNDIGPGLPGMNEFISRVRQTPLDSRINLVVERGTANGKISSFKVAVEPTPTSSGKSSIGLGVSPAVKEVKTTKAKDIFEAASIGTKQTVNLFNTIVSQFRAAASNGFDGASFGGPISILKTGAAVAKVDNSAVLLFAAMLSVNLGILNSIPLPILDGGQLAFVFIESIIGRKIPSKIQNGLTTATLLVMAVLSVSLFVGDIVRDDIVALAPTVRESIK